MSPANPTVKTYAALNQAFDFLNDRLLRAARLLLAEQR